MAGGSYSSLQSITPSSLWVNSTGSTGAATGIGQAVGIVINSHTSGTIALYDGTSAAGTLMNNTITLASGERWIPLFGAKFKTGLYVAVGGTIDYTIYYNQ